MTGLVAERCHQLAGTLAELKMKVRAALATELATAVGTAVRDVLVVAMLDRLVVTPARTATRAPVPNAVVGPRVMTVIVGTHQEIPGPTTTTPVTSAPRHAPNARKMRSVPKWNRRRRCRQSRPWPSV